jgi:hypothetical protein
VAGGPPAAARAGSEPSTTAASPVNSIFPRPSSSFDSQSQAGSATKIVSQACAGAYSDESTQFPRKNDLLNDENGANVRIKLTEQTDTNIFTLIYNQSSPRVIETRHLRGTDAYLYTFYTSQRPTDVDCSATYLTLPLPLPDADYT